MNVTGRRPDLDMFLETQSLADEVVLKELGKLLGLTLVAYIGSFTSQEQVRAFVGGIHPEQADVGNRLRLALRVAKLVSLSDGPNVVAWFQGRNPQLGDESPAKMVREAPLDEAESQVVSAARAFTIGG